MRSLTFKLIIVIQLVISNAHGQDIVSNNCDSTILTKEQYERCKSDTAWTHDILININYISSFKTAVLPKYRLIRKSLKLPPSLHDLVLKLKWSYDTILEKKLSVIEAGMDKNQKYVQPKAFIASLLSLQVFRFYPDVYAILLNNLHLQLEPITSSHELKTYKFQFDELIRSIPDELYDQLVKITKDFEIEKMNLYKHGFSPQFQSLAGDEYRSHYNIANFLLWTD